MDLRAVLDARACLNLNVAPYDQKFRASSKRDEFSQNFFTIIHFQTL
jgi:hypothetical protein